MSLPLIACAVTLAAVALACAARWLLDPLLGERLPVATFFVAVVIAARIWGLLSALWATGPGFVLACYFFLQPCYSFDGIPGPHLIGLAMFFMVCLATAWPVSARPCESPSAGRPNRRSDCK
jgi:K+-sensing histidine kinase KdpD